MESPVVWLCLYLCTWAFNAMVSVSLNGLMKKDAVSVLDMILTIAGIVSLIAIAVATIPTIAVLSLFVGMSGFFIVILITINLVLHIIFSGRIVFSKMAFEY